MSQVTPKKYGGAPFYLVLLLIIVVATYMWYNGDTTGKQDDLSTAIGYIKTGENSPQKVTLNGYTLKFTYKADDGSTVNVSKNIPPLSIDHVLSILMTAKEDGKITGYEYAEPADVSSILSVVTIVIMVAAMGFFLWFSFSRAQGEGKSAMSFGRSKAKLNDPSKN